MTREVIQIWLGMVLGGWLTWLLHHWVDPAQFLLGCTAGMFFASAFAAPR